MGTLLSLWAYNRGRRPVEKPERQAMYPEDDSDEGVDMFFCAWYVGMWVLNLTVATVGVIAYMFARERGVDQQTVDEIGRWFWSALAGSMTVHCIIGFRQEIAERPRLNRRIPVRLRPPSDWYFATIPLIGAPFFFVLNPFLDA